MNFQETGLPNNQVVEDAFDYSYQNSMSRQKEAMLDLTQQVNLSFMESMRALEADKKDKIVTDDEYTREKEALEKMRDEQLKRSVALVERELNRNFEARRVAPALEIYKHSGSSSPQLIAAMMLIDCVRSPIDYQRVAKKFGDTIASLIAEVQHIDAYPSERDTLLEKSGKDTKRVYMALLVTSLTQTVAQAKLMAKLNPPQKIIFPPGQEESLFRNVERLWGNDKELDARFVESFNLTAEATKSVFRMEVNSDNVLELIKGASSTPRDPGKKPPKPPGPGTPGKKGGSIGEDVF